MATLNVQKVTLKKELSFGNVYTLMGTIDGELDTVEFTTKPQYAPKVGDTLEGTVEDTDYGKKFKKAMAPGGFNRGGGRTPEEQDAIMRQHAVTDAISLMTLIGDKNLATKENAIGLAEYFLVYYKTGKKPQAVTKSREINDIPVEDSPDEEVPF